MKKRVSFLTGNLKVLRAYLNLTQEEIANEMEMTRVKWASYESGYAKNLPVEDLISLSEFFKLSIDTLVKVDLASLSEKKMQELLAGNDTYVTGGKLRVLHATLDSDGNENIELVPIRAKAGYTTGYNDPEFIQNLPVFQLPFLSNNKKFRTFQIDGDSMEPIPTKSYIIAEYVDNWFDIKDGQAYVIVTKNDGVVFKIAYNQLQKNKFLTLHSYNTYYKDYDVMADEILEVWRFVSYITHELPDPQVHQQAFMEELSNMEKRISHMKSKMKN